MRNVYLWKLFHDQNFITLKFNVAVKTCELYFHLKIQFIENFVLQT